MKEECKNFMNGYIIASIMFCFFGIFLLIAIDTSQINVKSGYLIYSFATGLVTVMYCMLILGTKKE